MIQQPNCPICHGAGVLTRNPISGLLMLCGCIPILSDCECQGNRNWCDAGIERLRKAVVDDRQA